MLMQSEIGTAGKKPMGTAIIKIPLVTWRDGRPRYFPSPKHRKLMGYKGEDLRHGGGAWFTVEECSAWSDIRLAEIEEKGARLDEGAPPAKIKHQVRAAHASRLPTLGQVITDFIEKDPRNQGKEIVEGRKRRKPRKPNTIRFYKNSAAQIEYLDKGRFWFELAGAITTANLETLLDRLEIVNGLATARGARTMLSCAFKFGKKRNKVSFNPVALSDERLPVLAPRVRYGSIAEMKSLIAAADAIGRHDVGDAICLGLWTAQRQGDRLALSDMQISDAGILFRQNKKDGQPLLIPRAPELAQRLQAARQRRKEWRTNYPHIVLDEVARRPFKADWYRKVFREVRNAACEGVTADDGTQLTEACPSLHDFTDQDLRDTAVTWLALAGCDKFEISSITGHGLASIDNILKHYLGIHPDMARTAIGRLVTWYEGSDG